MRIGKADSLSRNVLSNSAGYFLSILLALIVSPVVIRTLGSARYGIWSLIAEITGYYGFLDLGIRAAVAYYVAHFFSRGETDELNHSVNSGFWSLLLVGSSVGTLGFIGALLFSPSGVPGASGQEIRIALCIMSITIGLTIPMEVINSVINGHKRLDVIALIDIATRILNAAAIYTAMKTGGGLIELSVIQCLSKLLAWSLAFRAMRAIAPEVKLKPSYLRWASLKQLASIGSRTLVINVTQLVTTRSDLLVIGAFLDIRMVAYYNIGRMMVDYGYSAVRTAALAFTMHLTHAWASGRKEEAVRLYLMGVRLTGLAAVLLTTYLFVFGKAFIALWIDPSYVTGPWTERSDVIMMILVVGYVPRMFHHITYQLMVAAREFDFSMWLSMSEAAIKIVLSLWLVQVYGPAGVAFSSAVPAVALYVTIMPLKIFRTVPLTPGRYISRGIGRPVAVGAIVLVSSFAIASVRTPDTWLIFFAETIPALLIGIAASAMIGLNGDERRMIIDRIAGRLGVPRDQRASAGRRYTL